MLDEIVGSLFCETVLYLLRLALFPVALAVCAPFILIHAAVLASRRVATFRNVVADDHSSVDVFWWP